MKKGKFEHSPIEPAHYMHVRLQEDLFNIYSTIRENIQHEIDVAFDQIARQIGSVVATSIPVRMKFDKEGIISGGVIIDNEQLQNTVFEEFLSEPLARMGKMQFPKQIQEGEYVIYLFWFEALKLKLHTDWVEPAHYKRVTKFDQLKSGKLMESVQSKERVFVKSEVIEPVHWFDKGILIASEEAILINVIDEVYPELNLVEKISKIRALQSKR
jgi:hypothetical protein